MLLKAIILGIIQGLSEFLPISSSGHLAIAEHFLGFKNPDLSFEIFIHFGSLIAVFIYFRKDILALLKSLNFGSKTEENVNNRKVILYLLVSTIVTVFLALFMKSYIEKVFESTLVVGFILIVNGFILLSSDFAKKCDKPSSETGILRAAIIGIGQSLALLPGISRSGTTISTALHTGMKREDAARYSFLLAIPAILGATVLEYKTLLSLNQEMMIMYLAGAIAAFVSGYLVISALLAVIKKRKLIYFAIYCWIVAITVIVLQLMVI